MKHTCVICQREFEGYGNNAEPVAAGRCCDECNMSVVIPARLEATGYLVEGIMNRGSFVKR